MSEDSERTTIATHQAVSRRPLPSGVTARSFRKDDEAAVVDLFTTVFGHWPPWEVPSGSMEFLRWALAAPDPMRGEVMVAEYNARIIGATLRLIRPAWVDGRMRRARLSMYVAVDESMRGRGVRRVMSEATPMNHDLAWGFSQVAVFQRSRERLQSGVVNPLSVFLRVQSAPGAAEDRSAGRRMLKTAGYAWAQLQGRLQHRRAVRATWIVRRVARFDDRVEAFLKRASEPFDFIALRTQEFLNWRYCDPRAGEFVVLVAEEHGELLGYVALRVVGTRGHVADLLALPGREDVARSLIDDAMRHFESAGTSGVECLMMLHHPYASVLRRAGFVRLADRSETMARKFSIWGPRSSSVAFDFMSDEAAAIHLVEGDSDLI